MNVSLFQAAQALDANSRWQEVIADNLASSSVPGYKQQQLSQEAIHAGLLPGNGGKDAAHYFSVPQTSTSTNFTQGEFKYTSNNTDVAIEGKGFFEVELPGGVKGLTRDGEFRVNSARQLVTKENLPVLGKNGVIQFTPDDEGPITISDSGDVSKGNHMRGKLKVVDADKPQALTQISGGYFMAKPGKVNLKDVTTSVRAGYIESSNSSTLMEMASMMTASRSFEANQHVIQIQDDRMNKTISDLGNPTS